jgi:protein phosphatase 2C-like protein
MTSISDWKVLCASAIGSKNLNHNLPLQDFGVGEIDPFPTLIIADGAGSQVNSKIGAETAVQVSIDYIIANNFKIKDKDKCLELYKIVVSALRKKAKEMNVKTSTLATTLIIVYVLDQYVYWMHIGDGLIIAKNKDFISCVSVPFKGEYANQTIFVTSHDATDFIQYGSFLASTCDGMLVSSDGLSPALVDENSLTPAPICSKLMDQLRKKPLQLDDLKHLLSNELSGVSGDDKTLGILVPIRQDKKNDEFYKTYMVEICV